MQKPARIDFAKLFGFELVTRNISRGLDLQNETVGARLGAKVGIEVTGGIASKMRPLATSLVRRSGKRFSDRALANSDNHLQGVGSAPLLFLIFGANVRPKWLSPVLGCRYVASDNPLCGRRIASVCAPCCVFDMGVFLRQRCVGGRIFGLRFLD
jgi:hypothetical protein